MAEELHIQILEIKQQGRGGEGKLEQMQHLAGFLLKMGSWVSCTGFQPTN